MSPSFSRQAFLLQGRQIQRPAVKGFFRHRNSFHPAHLKDPELLLFQAKAVDLPGGVAEPELHRFNPAVCGLAAGTVIGKGKHPAFQNRLFDPLEFFPLLRAVSLACLSRR